MDGYAQYQQNQILTASPAKLLLMAYDGAIRFCRIASEKMAEEKFDEQSVNINKALAVVCELLCTLKDEVDPALTGRLKSIYTYVIEKLGYANMKQDQEALAEAIRILTDLRQTWAQAEMMLQQNSREAAA